MDLFLGCSLLKTSLAKHKKPKHLFTMPPKGMPILGLKADGRKISNSSCMGSVSKDHSGTAGVGDWAEDGVLLGSFSQQDAFLGEF